MRNNVRQSGGLGMPEGTVIDAIDDLWYRFYVARSLFPRMNADLAGVRSVGAARLLCRVPVRRCGDEAASLRG